MARALLGLILLLAVPEDPTFTLQGAVTLKGPPPLPKMIKQIEGDQGCFALHKDLPLREDLLADKDGGVRWAFVYVKKGLEGKTFAPPKEALMLDQKGCLYIPHVFGIQVGQPLRILNSDPMLHNVFGLGFVNPQFNDSVPPGGEIQRAFKQPEQMYSFKCSIHPWMGAWAGVVDHPFFAVTDGAGKYEIKGLPAGKYTVAVWQEKCGATEQEIEVGQGATLDFLLAARK